MTIRRASSFTAILTIAILSLVALSARAETPPVFFIERIEVRNVKRASPQVVRSESLLREGQAYSERQLRDAQSRIRRLPFVLDVEFSLEKGSEREAYVLVVNVDEASPFFVGIDHQVGRFGSDGRFTDFTPVNAGLRWFVGDYGQLHASVAREDLSRGGTAASLGYTHYNLLGRSIFLNTGISSLVEGSGDHWAADGVLGVPLRGNHAVRLQLRGIRNSRDVVNFQTGETATEETRAGSVGASWIYDTTNDALFPTDGLASVAGVSQGRFETSGPPILLPDGTLLERESTTDQLRYEVIARKYWPMRDLDAIRVGGRLDRSEFSETFPRDRSVSTIEIDGAYTGSFWGLEKTRRYGDLRYEAGLRAVHLESRPGFMGGTNQSDHIQLVTGVAHRNRWALIRAEFVWTVDADDVW